MTSFQERRSAMAVIHPSSSLARARVIPLPWHSSSGSIRQRWRRKSRPKRKRRSVKKLSLSHRKQNRRPLRRKKRSRLWRKKKPPKCQPRQKSRNRRSDAGSAGNPTPRNNTRPRERSVTALQYLEVSQNPEPTDSGLVSDQVAVSFV